MKEMVRKYFDDGYLYSDIIKIMNDNHGISISLRSLYRIAQSIGLSRRNYADVSEVETYVRHELEGPGVLLGQNAMWRSLQTTHYLTAKRSDVRAIMQRIRPSTSITGLRANFVRRSYYSLGPNYVWHADGYDKLKPYGFGISGCIT